MKRRQWVMWQLFDQRGRFYGTPQPTRRLAKMQIVGAGVTWKDAQAAGIVLARVLVLTLPEDA